MHNAIDCLSEYNINKEILGMPALQPALDSFEEAVKPLDGAADPNRHSFSSAVRSENSHMF